MVKEPAYLPMGTSTVGRTLSCAMFTALEAGVARSEGQKFTAKLTGIRQSVTTVLLTKHMPLYWASLRSEPAESRIDSCFQQDLQVTQAL